MSYTYRLRSYTSTPDPTTFQRVVTYGPQYDIQVSMAWLQGFYSAQLLAGTYGITENTNSDLEQIGSILLSSGYGFELNRVRPSNEPAAEDSIETVTAEDGTKVIPVKEFPKAFQLPLDNALSMSIGDSSVYAVDFDIKYLPYHVVAQFSRAIEEVVIPEAIGIDTRGMKKTDLLWKNIMRYNSDDDTSKYYISPSPDAKDCFLVKVPVNLRSQEDLNKFLQGFLAYFKWITQAFPEHQMPKFYLHDYRDYVELKNETGMYAKPQYPVSSMLLNPQ